MKIYKSNYRNHWISPYTMIDYAFFWTDWSKCSRYKGIVNDADYIDHPAWVEHYVGIIRPVSTAICAVLDFIHPRVSYVKIDRWDTWNMDHTLSDIVLPMLRQLQATKQGAPVTDDSDVPEELRSTLAEPKENEWDTDSNHFERWEWIIDEMIWSFEQKTKDDAEGQFFDHSVAKNVDVSVKEWFADVNNRLNKTKFDEEGHKVWSDRKANGFRLFGKYFEALWD